MDYIASSHSWMKMKHTIIGLQCFLMLEFHHEDYGLQVLWNISPNSINLLTIYKFQVTGHLLSPCILIFLHICALNTKWHPNDSEN